MATEDPLSRRLHRVVGTALGNFAGLAVGSLAFGYLASRFLNQFEKERAADMMIAEADRQIDLQYSNSDGQDLKTLGLVAGAIATAALVAATQQGWDWRWIFPLLIFIASIGCYIRSLWQEEFQRGPNLAAFYSSFSGTILEAKAAMLHHLLDAVQHNQDLRRRRPGGTRAAPGRWRWRAPGRQSSSSLRSSRAKIGTPMADKETPKPAPNSPFPALPKLTVPNATDQKGLSHADLEKRAGGTRRP